jgi:hypothetical protein
MLARVLAHHRSVALATGVVIACAAWAPTAAADPWPDPRTWLGFEADLLLAGQIKGGINNTTTTDDANSTAALGVVLDYRAAPWLTIGFAPRVVLGVEANNGNNMSFTQLDLRLRVTAGQQVAPRLRLYGIGTLGYSIVFNEVLDIINNTRVNSDGLIWSLGGGIAYSIAPRVRLTGEVSYQVGYQGTTIQGQSITASDNYLTIGVGVMTALD